MRSDIRVRFGRTRQDSHEHYFRVQISWDGGHGFADALVMKRDDRDGPDRKSRPYRVEWAATTELANKAEAALGRLATRYSARDTKSILRGLLKGMPHHSVPPDSEMPVDLGVRIADSRIVMGVYAGTGPSTWEQEADAVARRRAGIRDQTGDEGWVRMPELFRWVPWFWELAESVGDGRQAGLVERAKKVDWAGGRCAVLDQGDDKADPLTFFYHLAAIAGGTAKKRETVYASVAEVFGVESDLDYDRDDGFFFPIPPGLAVLFNNTGGDPQLLWEMFDQARAFDDTSGRADGADTFTKVLQIKGVGVPKLTQVLFLVNPRAFLPFDTMAVLPLGIGSFTKPPAELSWDEYLDEIGTIRAAFPDCHGYELNVIGYLWTSQGLPRDGNRWYQIGTTEDGWRDFRDNNWIHHGAQSGMQNPGGSEVLPETQQDDLFDKPEPGDVVLVHTGTAEGRGIGIVYRNDYGERLHRNDRIHVLWVNKKQAPLDAPMLTVGFSRAGRDSYKAFAKCDAYSPTLALLEPPEPRTSGSDQGKHPATLYAEFYRPLVARLRQKGVRPGRWKGRWRSFHTGYPEAVYGTGLDDDKAQVFLEFTGANREQRFRALLRHREEIDARVKGAVWIEERHEPWGTTVLLERDDTFSLTAPEEELEVTRVWMYDALLALKGAVQPHLDQVMQPAGPELPSLASLFQYLTDCGLLFPHELVVNYILALQTKRFAILTGISGTGKTQIAKAVAEHYGPARQAVVGKIPEDAIEIEVNPYQFKYSRIIIPVALAANLDLLGPDAPLSKRKIRVRYPQGQVALTYNQNRQGVTALLFRGEFKEWFRSNVKMGGRIWLRVQEGDAPDSDELEIGLSETETVDAPVRNYEVVSVRPDWVDNRGLLGYLNPLTDEYSTTPFLNLLLRARDEEERAETAGENPHPFFVILDEMNLARVEHYFSDFLSALESGEAIPLHKNDAIESGESASGTRVPKELKVPGNVLFTGTVNVDETTYMFSPKVLDRAFTIEFDYVDLEGFTTGEASDEASALDLDGDDSLDLLRSGSSGGHDWAPSREDWAEFSEQSVEHQKALLQLHGILEREHRHFGYRVANEIARFVNLAREQAAEADYRDAAVDAAFDLALLQKVLPKFHGTQQELQSLLEEIFRFAVRGGRKSSRKDQKVNLDNWEVVKGRLVTKSETQSPSGVAAAEGDEADSDNPDATDADTAPPAYPRTGAKVLRMLHRLRDRGFTSFIE